ncbi:type II secretion system F family protein [Mechercharimyces sp. CAU 1602]|uniref:type II secretion system F family protein n=1 Tax=Mechercharimyces sp. CAU 1602 TaxID=2973933 RepID=UPI0021626238|nr:type II secretion system F family protein [Mechercharimyces sp. CAU 1602]MCS1352432.1 type II secretion system F family protein [Mechercharimyces sp. CAU 1602]
MAIFLSVIGAWFCLLFGAISYFSFQKEQVSVRSNLDVLIPPWKYLKQKSSQVHPVHRWMDGLSDTGKKIEILSDPIELEDILIKAGFPYQMTIDRIQGAKVLFMLGGLACGFVAYVIGLPFATLSLIFLPFIGYLLPIYGIKLLAKRRQDQIRYDLPDFLDMMSITLQAGMGLDEALAYYSETNKGPLSEEFARLNQEILFGVQRETAYRAFLRRTTSSELEALIQSLIQAHNLGTPIAATFAQQAQEMRRMRAEQAKEAAGKASPKISLVSTLLIAPSIMLLMVGAIVYGYFIAGDIFG